MHGSPLIGSVVGRWSRLADAVCPRALLFNIAVGIIAGVLAAKVRLHLGLSGHKALFWMVPILTARLTWRSPIGATLGASTAAGASLALGGNLAGGLPYVTLVFLAGGVLDAAIAFAQDRNFRPIAFILTLAMAGMLANIFCAAKRLVTPVFHHSVIPGLSGPLATILSYAFFGLLAGLVGTALGLSAARLSRGGHEDRPQ